MYRKVDIRLPEKGNARSMAHGRSTKMISMIKWIRTRRAMWQEELGKVAASPEVHPWILTNFRSFRFFELLT